MKNLLVLLLFPTLFFAQSKRQKTPIGVLETEDFKNIKEFLTSKNLAIKDTIIIKYEFNGDGCWSMLDEQDDDYIKKVSDGMNEYLKIFIDKHSGAVAYRIREKGKNFSKYVSRDPTISVDDNGILKNLLFNKRKMCGTTAVILDDGSYALKYGDSHFQVLKILENKPKSLTQN